MLLTNCLAKGISGGLKAGADMARAVPGFGTIAAAAMDAGAAITDMVTGWVNKVREKDRTKVSRSARLAYDPTNDNTGYSFGTRATFSYTSIWWTSWCNS